MVTDKAERCTRCGKRHLSEWVYLELNQATGHFATPGRVSADESQGLFRFGKTCAHRALAHERLADLRAGILDQCVRCDGDGFDHKGGNCDRCGGGGREPQPPARQRYCGPCDAWVPAGQRECRTCGAPTDPADK